MGQIKSIASILKEFDTDKLRDLWNTYCNEENPEDYIYYNDEYAINEMFNGNPYEAIRATQYGKYSFTDEYFIVNTYGNLTSFGDSDIASHINFDDLAEYVKGHGCDEINEVWFEDIEYDFINYVNDKMGSKLDVDAIPEDANLVTDDWDGIIEDYFKNED